MLTNHLPEAAAEYGKLPPTGQWSLTGRALLAGTSGDRGTSERLLKELTARFGDTSSFNRAKVFALWKQPDLAFVELRKTVAARSSLLATLKVDPFLGPLRSDALTAILQRHVFEDEEGQRDSVTSALQQDKYSLETLIQIAETAQSEYFNLWNSTSPDVSDAISVPA